METILKNSGIKKIFAVLMAMLFALSFTMTGVSAISSTDTGSITVRGLEEGATVNLYKIIDVNVNDAAGQPQDPMYKWNDTVIEHITSQFIDWTKDYNGVADIFDELTAAEEKEFLETLATDLSNDTGVTPITQSVQRDTKVKFEELSMGEYLIVVTGGTDKVYSVTSAKLIPEFKDNTWTVVNATVDVKSSSSTIDKEVVGGDLGVAVGDTVNYRVTATIPTFPTDADKTITSALVKIGDKLGAGLDLVANSVVVKNGSTILTNQEYTLATTSTEKYTFEVSLDTDYVLANPNAVITVEYSATVNENAFNTDALGNTAYQENRDPYSDSYSDNKPTTTVDVYTYGLNLSKVNTEGVELDGATFELYKGTKADANKMNFVKVSDGVYRLATNKEVTDKLSVTTLEVSSATDNKGQLLLQGIDFGTYVLTETKAATGMVLPNNPDITLTLVDTDVADGQLDTGSTASASFLYGDPVVTTVNPNILNVSVFNSDDAAFELPNTGGMGTMIFTVAGILLMAGAVVFIVISKKRA